MFKSLRLYWKIFSIKLQGFNYPYCSEWDKTLNTLLDEAEFVEIDSYNLSLKYKGFTFDVWISNKWYAYGHNYSNLPPNGHREYLQTRFRPSIKTMIRLSDYVDSLKPKKPTKWVNPIKE